MSAAFSASRQWEAATRLKLGAKYCESQSYKAAILSQHIISFALLEYSAGLLVDCAVLTVPCEEDEYVVFHDLDQRVIGRSFEAETTDVTSESYQTRTPFFE